MINTIEELRRWSRRQHGVGKRIGLVPTMGALHDGHLQLVRTANQYCDVTLVSIFVNPSQFSPSEDFHQYPRTLENDLQLLQTVGNPEVFVPGIEEMYPSGFDVSVHVGGVSQSFEGCARPTHFAGVVTVVLKLFLASGSDVAFFGQKDYQQVCVVQKMVTDLNVPVEIVVCPTVREPDGLAMSSRNSYLSVPHRKQAVVLPQSLEIAEQMIIRDKIRDAKMICERIRQTILSVSDFKIDYIAVADPITLQVLTEINIPEVVVLIAAKIGTTRLIDNRLIQY
jgi:pantoate--beta-alanine ligase